MPESRERTATNGGATRDDPARRAAPLREFPAGDLAAAELSALLLAVYGFSVRRRDLAECCARIAVALDCGWAALARIVGDGRRDQVLGCGAPPGRAVPGARDVVTALRALGPGDGLPVQGGDGAPVQFPAAAAAGGARALAGIALLARKDDCRYFLCLGAPLGPGGQAGVLQRMDLLLPHLRQALSLRDAIDEHRARVKVDASVLDRAPSAFVVLKPDGVIDFVNEPGRQLLAAGDGIRRAGALLDLHDPAMAGAVADLLGAMQRCDSADALESRDLLASRPSGAPPYLVTLLPVVIDGDDTILMTRRRMLVVITDPASGRLPSRNYLQQVFRLSPAEARVCQQMGGGQDLEEVARGLNLSLATVKSHLLRIYQKLGVNSRAQLFQRLQGHFWTSTPIVVRLDCGDGTGAEPGGN